MLSEKSRTNLAAVLDQGTVSSGGQYPPNATLLLIGFPGAGKKTLGIMASVALRRRFVDFAACFEEEFHVCPQAYIKENGSSRYLEAERRVYHDLLANNSHGCVIVGTGWIGSSGLQTLFKEFARRHPIIYIQRDQKALRRGMATTSPEMFERILRTGHLIFESCSNFDYYNLSEDLIPGAESSRPLYLKLKETEKTFVRFLKHIFGFPDQLPYSTELFSASPTYALQVPLAWLQRPPQNYDELENGTDAITLLVDSTEIGNCLLTDVLARSVALIRRHSRAFLIVDVQIPEHSDIPSHLNALARISRLAPDALTCSLVCDDADYMRLAGNIGRTKLIATYHQSTPLEWNEDHHRFTLMCNRAHALGCAAIRITGESRCLEDNLGCVSFQQNITRLSPISVIAHNVGGAGRASACLNPVLAPVVLESMRPNGVTLREAQLSLSSCFLYQKKRYTIIGQDLSYSLSPEMHNNAYAACGLPHIYDLTKTSILSDINRLLDSDDYGGVAVSLPYKTEVLKYLDEVSEDARNINAVNTVVVEMCQQPGEPARRLRRGYNTDYVGLQNCVHKHLSPANGIRDGTAALIIGAGGMARAAVYACYQLGVRNICIFNRTARNAQALIDYFTQWAASKPGPGLTFTLLQSTSTGWPSHLRPPTIVISCIPHVESDHKSPAVHIPVQWLRSKTGGVYIEVTFFLVDLVGWVSNVVIQVAYGPRRTSFLTQMEAYRSKGWIIVDGFDLLLEQGIAQYELFTRRPAPVHVMRDTIQKLKFSS